MNLRGCKQARGAIALYVFVVAGPQRVDSLEQDLEYHELKHSAVGGAVLRLVGKGESRTLKVENIGASGDAGMRISDTQRTLLAWSCDWEVAAPKSEPAARPVVKAEVELDCESVRNRVLYLESQMPNSTEVLLTVDVSNVSRSASYEVFSDANAVASAVVSELSSVQVRSPDGRSGSSGQGSGPDRVALPSGIAVTAANVVDKPAFVLNWLRPMLFVLPGNVTAVGNRIVINATAPSDECSSISSIVLRLAEVDHVTILDESAVH